MSINNNDDKCYKCGEKAEYLILDRKLCEACYRKTKIDMKTMDTFLDRFVSFIKDEETKNEHPNVFDNPSEIIISVFQTNKEDNIKKIDKEAESQIAKQNIKQKDSIKSNNNKGFILPEYTPSSLKNELDKYVIGQEKAKKIICSQVYNHYVKVLNKNKLMKMNKELSKTNILMIGPSGVGKTFLIQSLAKIINVPCLIVDATTFTETGYAGEDVDSIIEKLLIKCQYDVNLAEKSIIIIDEIDKIAKKASSNTSSGRDISGEGVQQSLLKLIEGKTFTLTRKNQRNVEIIEIDTSNILFIGLGAFVNIEEFVRERTKTQNKPTIGFNSEIKRKEKDKTNEELREIINTDDLIKFGLIPEFIGRFPVVSKLHELSKTDLKNILTNSEHGLLNEINTLFLMQNKEIEFDNEAINKIIDIAYEKKLGARSLKTIIEDILLEVSFSLPDSKKKKYKITSEYIDSINLAVN